GDIVAAPALEPESLEFRDLAARAGGGFWATAVDRMTAETFLVQLDEEGAITDRFPAPEEPASNPILAARAGRVHVVYTVFNEPPSDELHTAASGGTPCPRRPPGARRPPVPVRARSTRIELPEAAAEAA